VDNEVVNVSRPASDEAVWSSDGDDFTITFPTSPFERFPCSTYLGAEVQASFRLGQVRRSAVTHTSSTTIPLAKALILRLT
jgi:hypothetical protein